MRQWQADNKEPIAIDLFRVMQILWKRIWVLAIAAIVFGTAAFTYTSLLVTPLYRSNFTAYVNNRMQTESASGTSTSDLNASIGLSYLYGEIVESRAVLTDAAQKCGLDYTYAELAGMVNTTISEKAALINVAVTAPDPVLAAEFAAAIADVAPDHVARVVDGSSMRIVDDPVQPLTPSSPNTVKSAVLGALIGVLLAATVLVVLELVYDYVQNDDDLEGRYGIVVVGRIPDATQFDKAQRQAYKMKVLGSR